MLRVIDSRDREILDAILHGRGLRLSQAERAVEPILSAVRERGDEALLEYARKLDGLG